MKKMIIIEENGSDNRKKLVNNKLIEWVLYLVCYAVVLIFVSTCFKGLDINNDYFGLYAFLAAFIIYILNQTIKPILFYITLPLTALSLGLFYPIINVLILKMTSFILGPENFNVYGMLSSFFIAIIISILNLLMEGIIIKPIIKGHDNYE